MKDNDRTVFKLCPINKDNVGQQPSMILVSFIWIKAIALTAQCGYSFERHDEVVPCDETRFSRVSSNPIGDSWFDESLCGNPVYSYG